MSCACALSGSAGLNTIIDLTVDGKVYPSIIKDIQRHPVKRNVQHVDFIQVNLNEEITIGVPIVLEGEAHDVLANNGLVDLAVQELQVRTTPRQIPDAIVIDVTDFTIDTVIRIEDLTLPAGVDAIGEPDTPGRHRARHARHRGRGSRSRRGRGRRRRGRGAAAEGDAEAAGDAAPTTDRPTTRRVPDRS